MDSIQTNKGKEILTFWAKTCATALPCLTMWEKDELWKEFTRIRVSYTKWPMDECSKSQPLSALITASKSPSNWHCWRLSSAKNMTTRRLAANISKLSTLCGLRIFFNHRCHNLPHRVPNHDTNPKLITLTEHCAIEICFIVPLFWRWPFAASNLISFAVVAANEFTKDW